MIHLHQIDPVAIRFPAFELLGRTFQPEIHWYGLMYLLGFAVFWWLGSRRIRDGRLPGVDANAFGDLLFYGLLGVILGGRLGSILFYDLDGYLQDPIRMIKVWEGGMSFHGGLVGVLVATWYWSRKYRRNFFDTVDFIAPMVPPGLGFGRIGNFIGAELWGKYTNAGWGVVFPTDPQFAGWSAAQLQEGFASGALDAYARHPSQLYQAILEGLVMFAVLWWFSSRPRPRYAVSGLFALMYGVFRFLVEFVRVPDADIGYIAFGWLTMGQLLSLPLVMLGVYWLLKSHHSPTVRPAIGGEGA
jgi:phosphatidylglycerol:prolipoprotein diacylglycerol transferase